MSALKPRNKTGTVKGRWIAAYLARYPAWRTFVAWWVTAAIWVYTGEIRLPRAAEAAPGRRPAARPTDHRTYPVEATSMTAAEAREIVLGAHPTARVVWDDGVNGTERRCRIVADVGRRQGVQISHGHKSEGLAWMRAARIYFDKLADELSFPA